MAVSVAAAGKKTFFQCPLRPANNVFSPLAAVGKKTLFQCPLWQWMAKKRFSSARYGSGG